MDIAGTSWKFSEVSALKEVIAICVVRNRALLGVFFARIFGALKSNV